jgi:hypothetical protein
VREPTISYIRSTVKMRMPTASWHKMYLTMPPITSLACSTGAHHYESKGNDRVGVTFGDVVSMVAEHDPEWWKGTARHRLEWYQLSVLSSSQTSHC